MDDKKKELEAIRTMALRLLNKIDAMSVDLDSIEEPAETQAKMAKRVCLGCGITVKENDSYRRGLHEACYHTTMRRIRDGDWSEKERIESGKIAKEGGKPGRPAAIDAAEVIAKSIADKLDGKPKKVADKKSGYRKDS